jgi:RHS repeat-associated protein
MRKGVGGGTVGMGGEVARQLYYPYGQVRWSDGTLPTDYTFTGQRNESSFGLMDYNARYYDPYLSRFIQADTIVPQPGNPQSLNRYAYTLGNPLRYADPSGHYSEEEIMQSFGVDSWDEVLALFDRTRYIGPKGELARLWGWLEVLRQAQDGDFVSGDMDLMFDQSSCYSACYKSGDPINGARFSRDAGGHILVGGTGHAEFAVGKSLYSLWQAVPQSLAWTYKFSTVADSKHYHMHFDASKVDWVDAGFDVAGITADLFTVGIGGRAVNVIQAAGKTGSLVDALSIAYSWYSNFDGVLDGESAWGALSDVSLSYAGIGIQFWPDTISLVSNIAGAVTITN